LCSQAPPSAAAKTALISFFPDVGNLPDSSQNFIASMSGQPQGEQDRIGRDLADDLNDLAATLSLGAHPQPTRFVDDSSQLCPIKGTVIRHHDFLVARFS
jgi:hypothetical protein